MVHSMRPVVISRKKTAEIIVGLALFMLTGCATRSYTKAHSDIIAESKANGEAVRTVDEENAIYKDFQKKNRENLYALLKRRDVKKGTVNKDFDYVLASGDAVDLTVLGVDELNGSFHITQTGIVSFPLIGPVKLGGLTESAATDALRLKLTQQLRDPQFTLLISDFQGNNVSVLGAVSKPGKQILRKDRNSLRDVVGAAGGPSLDAGNYITLIPKDGALENASSLADAARASLEGAKVKGVEQQGIEIPISAALGLNSGAIVDVPLRSGDVVLIQPSGKVMVEGEVDKRGEFSLGGNATLVSALAAAGGISYGARLDEVEIVRKLGVNEKVTLVYNLLAIQNGTENNPLLKNGDIVRVPSATGTRVSQDVFKAFQGLFGMRLSGNVSY